MLLPELLNEEARLYVPSAALGHLKRTTVEEVVAVKRTVALGTVVFHHPQDSALTLPFTAGRGGQRTDARGRHCKIPDFGDLIWTQTHQRFRRQTDPADQLKRRPRRGSLVARQKCM